MAERCEKGDAQLDFTALFKADAFAGILLIAVAVVALVVANSGVSAAYFELFNGYLWDKEVVALQIRYPLPPHPSLI